MIVMVSGGFDPAHTGHLDLIRAAAGYGRVVIALNSDAWLIRKKGYRLMPWEDRRRILMAMRDVHDVIVVDDADGTVCEALRRERPRMFANGGDRTTANPAEAKVCRELGIQQLFDVGGGKSGSSSELVREAIRSLRERPTG